MRQSIVICGMVAGLAIVASPASAQQLQLPDMAQLSAGAVDVVDVSVDQALLGLAASFMSNGADDKEVKALISSLKGIYVKSFTYGKDGAYDPAVLDSVRRQLSGGQWSRLLAAKSAAEGSDTAIYLWRNGGKAGGLAVLSASPREVTLVNIVGTIDLEQLRMLQGKFGVPDLKMEGAPGKTTAPKPKQ
ncbi:hypothetical protein LuPra_03141 [Luteitalea pratensis]|uniref:DUF4252 domain-containing protein n=1 Tax=Luteitalea pratensis TaxID=1855912 RepID=A0A143PQ16_LUTPR|nr:DUF4252 domain-containing protein [Luteitalea pratensis]AMY09914.1 hypothetical protein LuPra_03141 [Luteitalea pratensis]